MLRRNSEVLYVRTMSSGLMGTPSTYDAWIFDLDGTLTVQQHDFDELRRRLGFAEGAPILETIETAPEGARTDLLAVVEEWEWEVAERTIIAPGVEALLMALSGVVDHLGVLTRNRRDIALHTLEMINLKRYFGDADILGRDEALPKPEPAGVELLLNRWGQPESAVMVGDYLYDMQAGKAAGCDTILIASELPVSWRQWVSTHVRSATEINIC